MHVGTSLFSQVMEFVPWTSFARIVQRYSGSAGVRTLSCAAQFRAMAFAQLTAQAPDSTTIDVCLSVFPWAHFRSTKAAVKIHTLLDLRGNIPSFIHVCAGKLHDVNVLDLLVPEPGAFHAMDRGAPPTQN